MATTLELTASGTTQLDQYQRKKSSLINSMQRTRGMGRPHQGDSSSTELNSQTPVVPSEMVPTQQSHPPRPTRNNSKLKVLVRSHAMREETSPPRVPTPTNITAPCITVNTSETTCPDGALHEEQSSDLQHHHHHHQQQKIFYNHSRTSSPSKPLSPIMSSQKPCLIVSPTPEDALLSPSTSPSSPNIDNNSSLRNNNNNNNNINNKQQTVTVRTQDVLNSTITRKFNGDLQENSKNSDLYLNKCEIVMNSNTTTPTPTTTSTKTSNNNSNNSVTINNNCSSLKQQTSAMNNSQRNVDNSQHQQKQQHFNNSNNCECVIQNCTKCFKNNELNINNNSNNIINNNNVTHTTCTSTSSVSSSSSSQSHNNTLTVNRANPRHKLRHQSSSQGSFEGSSSNSPCLSRDSSTEWYTDTHGTDLTQFLIETLNKNPKDRVFMFKVEIDLVNLAKDPSQKQFKFPAMSSYQRMLVHRCAAYFGMDHNIEPSGKAVVVSKNRNTRIPEMRFKDHIREDLLFPEEPRRSILKRDSNSFEDCNYKSPDRQFDNRRSKSFEEREEEYERARRRIFKDGTMQDCNSQEEFNWAEMPWPENECTKIRLLHPEQSAKQNRLLKVQSVEGRETLRPCVAKSYSFGGYGGSVSVLSRGDSITSTHSAGPRLLTKQDSSTSTISWRLSPSSSGYKTQSQRSDSVTPSPTATPHQLSDASGKNSVEGIDPIEHSITEETLEQTQQSEAPGAETNQLIWAVTDMQSVPKGSVLIDPQTGQPFTNQDGSIYHFDPSNPPPGFPTSKPPPSSSPPTVSATAPAAPTAAPVATAVVVENVSTPPPRISTPQSAAIKEQCSSPKKQSKSKVSPLKIKYSTSSTSPSLPMTPPLQFSNYRTPVDTPTLPAYPVYPNGFMSAPEGSVPVYQQPMGMVYAPYPQYDNRPDPQMSELSGYFVNMAMAEAQPVYQTTSGIGGYWSQAQQPITYYQAQPPPTIVSHQQVQAQAQTQTQQQQQQQQQQQRYPVQMPLAQTPPAYYPPTYPPNTELVPVYTNPVQMVYSPQPANPSNPVYIQTPNPSVVYTQNAIYPAQPAAPPPAAVAAAPAPPPPPLPLPIPLQLQPQQQPHLQPQPQVPIYNTNMNAQCYNNNNNQREQREQKEQNNRSTPRNNSNSKQCYVQKMQNQVYYPQSVHGSGSGSGSRSNHGGSAGSGGSNSPANTVIGGYMAPNTNAGLASNFNSNSNSNSNTPLSYRQCSTPDTPTAHHQHVTFGYPPPPLPLPLPLPPPHSLIFRQMGGVRASPPVNVRSSRSPTPAPEYSNMGQVGQMSQMGQMDRSQRYGVPTAVYHGIIPGDMRIMGGRGNQPTQYQHQYQYQYPHQHPPQHQHQNQNQHRQSYRQQNTPPNNHQENSSGRSHKMRKPRTKVPPLPPSGRQSNQSIQQRY